MPFLRTRSRKLSPLVITIFLAVNRAPKSCTHPCNIWGNLKCFLIVECVFVILVLPMIKSRSVFSRGKNSGDFLQLDFDLPVSNSNNNHNLFHIDQQKAARVATGVCLLVF